MPVLFKDILGQLSLAAGQTLRVNAAGTGVEAVALADIWSAPTTRIDVTAHGITGSDGSNIVGGLITLIDVTLGKKPATLFFPHTATGAFTEYDMRTHYTFPRNIELEFEAGARLQSSNLADIKLPDTLISGKYQCLKQNTGWFSFQTQVELIPHWLGAVDDIVAVKVANPVGTDCTAAIQACLDILQRSGGGVLNLRTKKGFLLNGNLMIDGYRNITFLGFSGANNYFDGTLNLVFTTAGAAPLISARSTVNMMYDGVGFFHTNNSYTGPMVFQGSSTGDPAFNTFRRCSFSGRDFNYGIGESVSPSARCGILLQSNINTVIEQCGFSNTIKGIDSMGYNNIITIRDNVFVYCLGYGIYATGGAEVWTVSENTFEGCTNDAIGKGLTRAMEVNGSGWSISFERNWLGDGLRGTATDDPMLKISKCYALEVNLNRFANYEGTQAWGMELDECLSPTVSNNRFEYMPGIKFAMYAGGFSYHPIISGNQNASPDLTGAIAPVYFGDDYNLIGGGLQVGGGGTDLVGAGTNAIGFGTMTGNVNNSYGVNRFGGGIRMGNGITVPTGLSDGMMIFTTRPDAGAGFSFWNITELFRAYNEEFRTIVPLRTGANGTKINSRRAARATLAAGTVTVADVNVTVNSNIFVQRQADGGTTGASYSITRTVGIGFTITAKNSVGGNEPADTSILAWEMVELT